MLTSELPATPACESGWESSPPRGWKWPRKRIFHTLVKLFFFFSPQLDKKMSFLNLHFKHIRKDKIKCNGINRISLLPRKIDSQFYADHYPWDQHATAERVNISFHTQSFPYILAWDRYHLIKRTYSIDQVEQYKMANSPLYVTYINGISYDLI